MVNSRTPLIALGIIVVLAAIAFSIVVASFPTIPDADSYFHLAVAREYAQHGLVKGLRWARLSVMHERFGDKELLFHIELIPAVLFGSGDHGGRVALVLANLIIVALLGAFGLRLAGPAGLLAPLIVYLAAPGFVVRVIRLRPELGAIALVIAFLWAASRRRTIVAGVIAGVFALSYTAVQLLPGLAILIAITGVILSRRSAEGAEHGEGPRPWLRLAVSACVGTCIGVLIHPHFPDNVHIWFLQNVEFFRVSALLDTGPEIARPTLRFLFVQNAGWWIAIAAIVVIAMRTHEKTAEPRNPATPQPFIFPLVVACIAFTLLQLRFERMSLYFFPVAALTALGSLRNTRVSRNAAIALGAALCVAILASSSATLMVLRRSTSDPGPVYPWHNDLEAFGRAVPRGARVAAPWGPAEFYTWYAPQGEYLDVLDPLFMFAHDRAAYQVQRSLFRGIDPDVPLSLVTTLRSDYLAFDRLDRTPLVDRVAHDPRLVPLYSGYNWLGATRPAAGAFVLDWHTQDGRTYPRHPDLRGRAVEGYVDMQRLAPPTVRCITVEHEETVPAPTRFAWEFAPYGIARLSIDGAPRAAATVSTGAILGRSPVVKATLAAGTHRITVETCRDDRFGQNGFYLVRR